MNESALAKFVKLLEPVVVEAIEGGPAPVHAELRPLMVGDIGLLSIAVSLRRIADALEGRITDALEGDPLRL